MMQYVNQPDKGSPCQVFCCVNFSRSHAPTSLPFSEANGNASLHGSDFFPLVPPFHLVNASQYPYCKATIPQQKNAPTQHQGRLNHEPKSR